MKTRMVYVTMAIETDEKMETLRDKSFWSLSVPASSTFRVHQVYVQVQQTRSCRSPGASSPQAKGCNNEN